MPNFSDIFIQTFLGIGGVFAIIALVNVVKNIKDLKAYNPILAIAFGIVINIVGIWTFDLISKVNIVSAVFVGILAGLIASGLYDYKKL